MSSRVRKVTPNKAFEQTPKSMATFRGVPGGGAQGRRYLSGGDFRISKKQFSVAFFAWLFYCSANAADEPIAVSGFADMSCGAWTATEHNAVGRAQYLAWFRGFITGVNYSTPQQQIGLERLPSNETLSLYVDKYCRDNPLSSFPGAAFALAKDLRK